MKLTNQIVLLAGRGHLRSYLDEGLLEGVDLEVDANPCADDGHNEEGQQYPFHDVDCGLVLNIFLELVQARL